MMSKKLNLTHGHFEIYDFRMPIRAFTGGIFAYDGIKKVLPILDKDLHTTSDKQRPSKCLPLQTSPAIQNEDVS